jgi:hypothetical protein
MRLPLLPPASLSSEQRELYDDIMGVVKESFGSFIVTREDGALMGPFNAMLHFPAFGRAAWAMNKTMYDHTTLPKSVLQVAVLVTGTRLGARYQIYGHERLAESAGVSSAKIATIVAGERPTDPTRDEAVAYDVAAPSGSIKSATSTVSSERTAPTTITIAGMFLLVLPFIRRSLMRF